MVLDLVGDIESVFEDDSPKIAELLKRLVAGMKYLFTLCCRRIFRYYLFISLCKTDLKTKFFQSQFLSIHIKFRALRKISVKILENVMLQPVLHIVFMRSSY